MPLYGCDCYAYALLSSGFVNLVIESGLKVKLLLKNDLSKVNASFINRYLVLFFYIILIEVNVIPHQPYDFLALVPVIDGAGGTITDWNGNSLLWEASSSAFATSMFNIPQKRTGFLSLSHKLITNKRSCNPWMPNYASPIYFFVVAAGDSDIHQQALESLEWQWKGFAGTLISYSMFLHHFLASYLRFWLKKLMVSG